MKSKPEWVCGFSDDDTLLQVRVTKFHETHHIAVLIAGEVVANNAERDEAEARDLASKHFTNWSCRLNAIHDNAVLKAHRIGYNAGVDDGLKCKEFPVGEKS